MSFYVWRTPLPPNNILYDAKHYRTKASEDVQSVARQVSTSILLAGAFSFVPKVIPIHVAVEKNGLLHIARNQRFIKVPNCSNYVAHKRIPTKKVKRE